MGNEESYVRTVINGLPQGSVLFLTLFNMHICDLPETKRLKFQYMGNIAIAYQSTYLKESGEALIEDLISIDKS